MKLTEGNTIALKFAFFLAVPALTPFVALFKSAEASGVMPNKIYVVGTALVALLGVANAGLAFTSGSFAKWQANSNQPPLPQTPAPTDNQQSK